MALASSATTVLPVGEVKNGYGERGMGLAAKSGCRSFFNWLIFLFHPGVAVGERLLDQGKRKSCRAETIFGQICSVAFFFHEIVHESSLAGHLQTFTAAQFLLDLSRFPQTRINPKQTYMSLKMPWNILMASRRALARRQRPRAAQMEAYRL